MKGFKKSLEPRKAEKSLECQIRLLINSYASTGDIISFGTVPKRKTALSNVVNKIAKDFVHLHFQVYLLDNDLWCIISPYQNNNKHRSYVWVEQYHQFSKWLIMASPPGCWEYKAIGFSNDKERAIEFANGIAHLIRNMSLNSWDKAGAGCLEVLNQLESRPNDFPLVAADLFANN
jgi:hypothetical protein